MSMEKTIADFRRTAQKCRRASDLAEALNAEHVDHDEFVGAVVLAEQSINAIVRHVSETTITQIDAILRANHDVEVEKCREAISALLGLDEQEGGDENTDSEDDDEGFSEDDVDDDGDEEEEEEEDDGEEEEGDDDGEGEEERLVAALELLGANIREVGRLLEYVATLLSARYFGASAPGDVHHYHGAVIKDSTVGGVSVGDRSRARGSVNSAAPGKKKPWSR